MCDIIDHLIMHMFIYLFKWCDWDLSVERVPRDGICRQSRPSKQWFNGLDLLYLSPLIPPLSFLFFFLHNPNYPKYVWTIWIIDKVLCVWYPSGTQRFLALTCTGCLISTTIACIERSKMSNTKVKLLWFHNAKFISFCFFVTLLGEIAISKEPCIKIRQ